MNSEMEVIVQCGFASISLDFIRKSGLKKGRLLYESGHVSGIKERIIHSTLNSEVINENLCQNAVGLSQKDTRRITAAVIPQTSIRNSPYNVELKISKNREVIEAKCECKAGSGIQAKCKHVAALFISVNEEKTDSCTSNPQLWGIPSKKCLEKYNKGKKIVDLFSTRTNQDKSYFNFSHPDPAIASSLLNSNIHCSVRNMLLEERKNEVDRNSCLVLRDLLNEVVNNDECSNIECILVSSFSDNRAINVSPYEVTRFNGLYMKLKRKVEKYNLPISEAAFYNSKICVSENDIVRICKDTRTQSKCTRWFTERKLRITASTAHSILTRRSNYEKLANQFVNPKSFKNAATQYGIKTEKQAKETFSAQRNVFISDMGLVICVSKPWLCCSPDGVFYPQTSKHSSSKELLEIKCPFTRKSRKIVDFNSQSSYVPYVYFEGGTPRLKNNHKYFTQIQISMYILGIQKCSFVVYSDEQIIVIDVMRDNEFLISAVCKLQDFYFQYVLPLLTKK